MTNSGFVLDTNAVIFLATKGNVIPSELQQELDEADIFISVITEIELFAKPSMPPDEEKNLREFISNMFSIIDITSDVKKETIAIRRNTKLKLPDSIVAASAIVQNAVLLSADAQLLHLSLPNFNVRNLIN